MPIGVGKTGCATVVGGAGYDALVGWTAKAAGATLVTRALRAVNTYERLGVGFALLT